MPKKAKREQKCESGRNKINMRINIYEENKTPIGNGKPDQN